MGGGGSTGNFLPVAIENLVSRWLTIISQGIGMSSVPNTKLSITAGYQQILSGDSGKSEPENAKTNTS